MNVFTYSRGNSEDRCLCLYCITKRIFQRLGGPIISEIFRPSGPAITGDDQYFMTVLDIIFLFSILLRGTADRMGLDCVRLVTGEDVFSR